MQMSFKSKCIMTNDIFNEVQTSPNSCTLTTVSLSVAQINNVDAFRQNFVDSSGRDILNTIINFQYKC